MNPRSPSFRTWLLVSVAVHACVFAPGQLFRGPAVVDCSRSPILVAFLEASPAPEPQAPPSEPEWLPVSASLPVPEPVPAPYPSALEAASLLDEDAPLSGVPVHDDALFASLGSTPLDRLRAPRPAAASEPASAAQAEPTAAPALEAAAEVGERQVIAPVAVHRRWPDYPRASLRLGEEGRVLLRIEIGANGWVCAATVAESSGFRRLDRAALAAVRAWRFRPALRDGTAGERTIMQPISFEISGRASAGVSR